MCGILGLVSKNNNSSFKNTKKEIAKLFLLSESRGKESSGITIRNTETKKIETIKEPIPASKLIKSKKYGLFLEKNLKQAKSFAIIGHSRLVTDGSEYNNDNNQPVEKSRCIAVHNGIIVNAKNLWEKYQNEIKKTYEVDTEIILDILRLNLKQKKDIAESIKNTLEETEGSASVAILFEDLNKLLLATNTGSLFFCINSQKNSLFFASEKYIISKFLKTTNKKNYEKQQIKPFTGKIIDLENLSITDFEFKKNEDKKTLSRAPKYEYKKIPEYDLDIFNKTKRCTRCILPETFPFIEFDEKGVCNYCKNHKKRELKGEESLKKTLEKYKNKKNQPDCIVTLSGGRDSCYGLHYIKKNMDMNPVVFTYDWAMVTDLARRNQARMCGKLGVEHIIFSADIRTKRDNIKKNILAWFKKPDLGIIPLFMAGDKQVYHYVKKLEKQTGIELKIWMDNKLENTDFKVGFSGIKPYFEKKQTDSMVYSQKIKLALYYLKNFLKNPSYINSSIFDTVWAYYSQFFKPRTNIFSLYEYIEWDEEKIVSTLINEYNWETAHDTASTWRIGDETAPFYNYIYYIMAGFTENDTFRSNQIRENMITREEALELVKKENCPRIDSINLYFKKAGLNMNFYDLQKKLDKHKLK